MSNLNEMNMQPQSDDEEIEKEEQEEADEEYQFSASELDIRSEEDFEEERRREKATLLERLRRLREPHLRRKMVLLEPCIPWEFGSNKYDSQKGTGGFGRIRDATTKVHSSKQLASLGDAADIPILSRAGFATQAGHTAFGSIRDQITKVLEHEGEPKKRCQELLSSPGQTGCQLSLWARPNPEAKNQKLFGSKRQEVGHCVGGRPWTREELARSRAALPRLWRVDDTAAARDGRHAVRGLSTGFVSHRQATTMVQGLDRSVEDQLESNRCQSWLGGQLLLQTQSRTGGFQKPRDVVNTSYYARLLSESGILPRQSSRNREEQQKGQHVKEGEAPAVNEALRLAGKEEKQTAGEQEENSNNRKNNAGGYGQR